VKAGVRIGIDENGLGARLGPMLVTAVLAEVDEGGARLLSRKLPKKLRADLDDSKRLVAHGNIALGEAWARVIAGGADSHPAELLTRLLAEDRSALTRHCPGHVEQQCWGVAGEAFGADEALLTRIRGHHRLLAERGVRLQLAKAHVLCSDRLNRLKAAGTNRFVADLHAMEGLFLSLRAGREAMVSAVCGKVGGIAEYGRFFGPLAGRLHTVLEEGRARSAYYFPTLGEIAFVRDADAADPLVMLASLVGKYLRELLMARVSRFYPEKLSEPDPPSGYHDPVSNRFVDATALIRKRRRVPDTCFQRFLDPQIDSAVSSEA